MTPLRKPDNIFTCFYQSDNGQWTVLTSSHADFKHIFCLLCELNYPLDIELSLLNTDVLWPISSFRKFFQSLPNRGPGQPDYVEHELQQFATELPIQLPCSQFHVLLVLCRLGARSLDIPQLLNSCESFVAKPGRHNTVEWSIVEVQAGRNNFAMFLNGLTVHGELDN